MEHTMTTLDFVGTSTFSAGQPPTTRASRFGIVMVQLHDHLWRITRTSGEVLGYIESFTESGDTRFRAKRMFSSARQSLSLGEFWSMDDAIDCFRFN
jgi:hypothetical protein